MKYCVTLNYFFQKLSCFGSLNSFLDEILFVRPIDGKPSNDNPFDDKNKDKKKRYKFLMFYKK